jgi:hypothetical protein
MAFIAARMSVARGHPPGEAGGISGSSRAHSTSQIARKMRFFSPIGLAVNLYPHGRSPPR